MLDRIKKEPARVMSFEPDWLGMTGVERRLIDLYRRLNEQEQKQLRRLFEVLATNPDEPDSTDYPVA
jgi:hypothetical protein